MTCTEFTECTLENTFLTPKEIIEIYQDISSKGRMSCSYSRHKRANIEQRKIVLNDLKLRSNSCQISGYNILAFTVNKPAIRFHGFGIYGRTQSALGQQNPENIIIKLIDENGTVLLQNIVAISYDGTNKIYDLYFKDTILLRVNLIKFTFKGKF